MADLPRRQVIAVAVAAAAGAALASPTNAYANSLARSPQDPDARAHGGGWSDAPAAVPVPLDQWADNDGIDTAGTPGGDFDGSGYTYPGEELPSGETTVDGIRFVFPSSTAGGNNNVVASGQRLDLPPGRYLSAIFLTACSYGQTSGSATFHYDDGTTSQAALGGPDWYAGSGSLVAPYRYDPSGAKDEHPVVIATAETALDPARQAVAVTLPVTGPARAGTAALHVFALSLQPAADGRALALRGIRATTTTLPDGSQSVEATVVNAGSAAVLAADGLRLTVDVPGARTVAPAAVGRLGPGEQARVRIGIRPGAETPPGTAATGSVVAASRGRTVASAKQRLTLGVPDFQPTDVSLATHQAPYWFQDAKFGIFIHWGVYSVPAWAPVGVQYAEWYWQQMQDPSNPVYAHHRDIYGEDFAYDDFIPRFRAERFDPRAWVELFRDAGAQYHVLTSKHHEGFALWDTKLSDRNAVRMGPKRDLVKELFDASKRYTPELHRGLYFSMPEWFNPDDPWEGHAPRNPYTLEPLPYTGYTAGKDYVEGYQALQMLELVDGYDPEIIWCDIGGANDSHHVLAEYFNHAKNRRRPIEVTVNDRSGIGPHDFTTPEYTTYDSVVTAKWEASRGLDPRSYGYNSATPDDQYMSTEEVVHSLVDIVSKNGNFLLDIGPRADGTIPEVMQQRLRETGAWLRTNGESIYGSTYWARMPQLGDDLRFTVQPDRAFYIHSLAEPGSRLVVGAPVPIRSGDRVTMLGHDRALSWRTEGDALVIDVPAAARAAGRHAWVFKVDWRS
ncbi:alpha-L-fucosidase [Streptomyces sp. 8L]|uniref:alpha-L-fucosidase n=1 Tax=Streptomyces sp. 8L TaxID=2877242 RepID=UPI001CD24778|nr:alpha-L-fucosidase [Streptomyces sp. 8L]MCA1219415.1 alpha-L-fucosidase [Streptomyces sp. 8L]